MFRGNRKYLWMFIGMFTMVVVLQYALPKPVNWQRTYSKTDKNPFGAYAINKLLIPAFGSRTLENSTTLYNLQSDSLRSYALLLMNDMVNLSKTDLKSLMEFIDRGNKVMIAANQFQGLLADTFHLRTSSKSYRYFIQPDSLIKRPGVTLRLKDKQESSYIYPMLCFDSYFTHYDSTRFEALSFNDDTSAVFISAKIGKGQLFLMSMPDVFSNYFIVNNSNRYYAYDLLSYISSPSTVIIWDEYYKRFNIKKDSFLKLIFENDSLYYAYLLMLVSIIVYMIFDGRRRQAAIPVAEPITNSTLEFVNVISHVYFNSHNHVYIVHDRIRFFYEAIRKRFGISTEIINDEFINTVADISGCDKALVRRLFLYCENLRKNSAAQELDLIELNRQINNFNNKSLR
jgi:hypothetical protein